MLIDSPFIPRSNLTNPILITPIFIYHLISLIPSVSYCSIHFIHLTWHRYSHICCHNSLIIEGTMAEWLRRQTWNLMGSARVGSNPACVVLLTNHTYNANPNQFVPTSRYNTTCSQTNKKRHWFSGRIQRCQRCGPGSIPGWRIFFNSANVQITYEIIHFCISSCTARWRSGSALGS